MCDPAEGLTIADRSAAKYVESKFITLYLHKLIEVSRLHEQNVPSFQTNATRPCAHIEGVQSI